MPQRYRHHEGSGLGGSERDIRKLSPDTSVLPGLAIRGGSVKSADSSLQSWISKKESSNK